MSKQSEQRRIFDCYGRLNPELEHQLDKLPMSVRVVSGVKVILFAAYAEGRASAFGQVQNWKVDHA